MENSGVGERLMDWETGSAATVTAVCLEQVWGLGRGIAHVAVLFFGPSNTDELLFQFPY